MGLADSKLLLSICDALEASGGTNGFVHYEAVDSWMHDKTLAETVASTPEFEESMKKITTDGTIQIQELLDCMEDYKMKEIQTLCATLTAASTERRRSVLDVTFRRAQRHLKESGAIEVLKLVTWLRNVKSFTGNAFFKEDTHGLTAGHMLDVMRKNQTHAMDFDQFLEYFQRWKLRHLKALEEGLPPDPRPEKMRTKRDDGQLGVIESFFGIEMDAKFRSYFSFFAGKDQKISGRDVIVLLRGLGYNPTCQEVESIFSNTHTHEHDFFSYDEFGAVIEEWICNEHEHLVQDGKMDGMFSVLDTMHTGRVSVADLRNTLTTRGEELNDVEFDSLMKLLNPDAGGFINIDEFKNVVLGDQPNRRPPDVILH
eukprot:35808_1